MVSVHYSFVKFKSNIIDMSDVHKTHLIRDSVDEIIIVFGNLHKKTKYIFLNIHKSIYCQSGAHNYL